MRQTFVFAAIGAALLAAGLMFGLHAGAEDPAPQVDKLVIVTPTGVKHVFEVEVADTPEKAEQGLMFRKSMADDHGMLFEFKSSRVVAFWMKNTLIPLDMVFVDRNGKIVRIAADTVPQSLAPITSGVAVTGVIEINGGRAAKLGIGPGDTVEHPFFGR